MTISCDYAMPFNPDEPDWVRYVNYHFGADSMTVYPPDHSAVLAFIEGGGTIAAYIPVVVADPDPPAPTVDPPCVARLDVADGDVQNVTADSGISFAFAIDTNVFQVYFAASKPNGYTWSVSATSGNAKVTDPQADYVEITVIDPTEPYSLSIQIFTVS